MPPSSEPSERSEPSPSIGGTAEVSLSSLVGRSAVGGFLMGLANLVPGISGGTMLLAAGVYPRFIQAVADLSTLKFKKNAMVTLGVVAFAAVIAIFALAGPVKQLVVDHRWVMYSLFIGLTLGGVPVVWGLAKPASPSVWGGAAGGFLFMAAIAWAQSSGADGGGNSEGWLLMFLAGVAGASAMILPGISGGYLLLILGVYVPILAGLDQFKNALKAGDMTAMMDPALSVVLPVGLGVVLGVLVVSNVLKVLLERAENPTLGALLGFLVGAVIGLWPFQAGIKPVVGQLVKGSVMTVELIEKMPAHKWPTEFFDPTSTQLAGALALVVVGFGITALVARLGKSADVG